MTVAPRGETPDIVAAPPLIVLPAFLCGLLIQHLFPVRLLPEPSAAYAGWTLIAIAGVIMVLVLVAFARARTPFDASRPTTALITGGVFRISRNPSYLALLAGSAGGGLVLDSVWILALLVPAAVVVDRGVVRREERYLERRWGEEYRRYRGRVRRWL